MDNPDYMSPWNPQKSLMITPKEYEQQVAEWLTCAGASLTQFQISHLAQLSGTGGEYEFDAVSEFSIFEGAQIIVLIECKRYNRPVEREVVLSLHSKLSDVGAHKAMIFSTSGFQRGALEYAAAHGIATITFIDGKSNYHTRSRNTHVSEIPEWIEFPKYAGWFISYSGNSIRSTIIENKELQPIEDWVKRDISIA